jgi:uncharacterized protein YjiS (DUF1127 family)
MRAANFGVREKKTASVAGPNGACLTMRHGRKNGSPAVHRSPLRICAARAATAIARWCHRAFEASLRRHILRVTRNTQLRELSKLDDRLLKDIGISRDEAYPDRGRVTGNESPLLRGRPHDKPVEFVADFDLTGKP